MKSHLTKCKQIMNEVPEVRFLLDDRLDCASRQRELAAVPANFGGERIPYRIRTCTGPLPDPESADESRGILVLSDSPAVCRGLMDRGVPAAGYLHEGNRAWDFSGVPYLLEEPQYLSADSAEKIWQRLTGRPWTIAWTRRLWIREMTEEDLDAVYLLYEDPQAKRFLEPLNEDRERERELLRAYIDRIYPLYGFGMWAVCDRESGELIGRMGFSPCQGPMQAMEMGYLIRADRRGEGLAAEAAEAVLRFAGEQIGATEVCAASMRENAASIALLCRMGFEEVDGGREQGILYFRKSL